jgi:hypothetical protein
LERAVEKDLDNVIIGEVQLILAEKRTSLASMRTGIAVLALPLSVLSVLVATSKHYEVMLVLHWLIPLLAICGAMILLGSYLIMRAIVSIHRHDRMIHKLKQNHGRIAEFIG